MFLLSIFFWLSSHPNQDFISSINPLWTPPPKYIFFCVPTLIIYRIITKLSDYEPVYPSRLKAPWEQEHTLIIHNPLNPSIPVVNAFKVKTELSTYAFWCRKGNKLEIICIVTLLYIINFTRDFGFPYYKKWLILIPHRVVCDD